MEYNNMMGESAEELYENAPCGYLSTLPDGTIVKVNRTFLNWLGYEAEELLNGKKFQDLTTIGCKVYYETHYAPLLRMQGFVNEINFDLKGKQKQKLPVLINTAQVKGQDGKPFLNRITVFDITDRKKYEQELLRAKKEAEKAASVKAEFLATVSHEIRTPLNAIITISNLLQDMEHTSEQEAYLKTLKVSADNLLHLVNDILDYSKIEAGGVELAEKNFSLRELLYSLLYSLGITAEEKGLELRVELDDNLPEYVVGDPVKIGQVLTNLLGNAIKFTPKGYVTVQVQELLEQEGILIFRVADTGIGIPEDKLDRVFKEFTQADYEINLKYGGTGLGLTISQKLLALYGSNLSVESKEGTGTVFSFPLRLKLGQEPQPNASAPAVVAESVIAGLRLLLVEDNPINILVISKYLDKWGIAFDIAKNGLEAVAKVTQQEYELVLMDLQMPLMDGYEATSRIRSMADAKYRKLPVIALSASASFDYKERMAAAGINDFVSKPFDAKVLYDKIASYTRSGNPEVPQAPKEEKPTQQQAGPPPAEGPVFSLVSFQELLENNEQDLEELVKMTIRNFSIAKEELAKTLRAHDLKAYRFCRHKIKMTVDLLQAQHLQKAIDDGRNLLEHLLPDKATVDRAIREIVVEFNSVILGLKEFLEGKYKIPEGAGVL